MRKALLIIALALVAGGSWLLWGRGLLRPDPAREAVAEVNGQKITRGEFSRRYDAFLSSLNLTPGDSRTPRDLPGKFLAKMADTLLLRQEAAARGVSVAPEEVEKELASLRGDLGEGADASKLAAYRDELADKLLVSRLMEAVTGSVTVTDAEIARYYQENPTQFNRPPMARARQIVTAREEEAKALRERALAGEDFALLAGASIAPEGAKGGDLGLFAQGEMPEEIDAAVFSLAPGQVSRVIKSPYGYHVIKVEERLPARTLTLADATPEIRAKLTAAGREEAFSRWLPTLRARAKISLFPERIGAPSADASK